MVIATSATVFENVQSLSYGPNCGSTVYVTRNVVRNPKKAHGDLKIPGINSFHSYVNIAGDDVVPIAVVHLPRKSGHLPMNAFLKISRTRSRSLSGQSSRRSLSARCSRKRSRSRNRSC
jgi:hypothetical protein